MNPISRLHQWAAEKDVYSLLNDFFFVFGVLFFDWNPVLIILWFMVDQAFMGGFVIALSYKVGKAGPLESLAGAILILFLTILLDQKWSKPACRQAGIKTNQCFLALYPNA